MHITHWNVVAVHGQVLFFFSGRKLLVILLHESCTNKFFSVCGNRFIKAIRYERQVLYREKVTAEGCGKVE